jgi:MFS family permease
MLAKIRKMYHEYPHTFWMLIVAVFIDHVGGALIFPFLSLYITHKFGVGMTQVGQIFAIFAICGVFGNIVGGAMTDKFGRKTMLIFGLVVSALSALFMGIINNFTAFYFLTAIVGLFSNAGGPAQQAMVADLLPEKQRAEGFGVMRVVANLAVVIGPAIGGLLASVNYLYLFILDAVISTITALFVLGVLPETKPKVSEEHEKEAFSKTLSGYGLVLKDGLFMVYILISMLLTISYMQMNSTLPVFLRDVHNIPPRGFGYLLSLNAAMVVIFQFWITRRLKGYPPMLMMALGTLLVGIGLTIYGFTSLYAVFVLAMVILTIGEMVWAPVGQSLVARFAPEHMRGRYMALFGFTWIIPSAVGPLAAGIIMDNYNPNWVWYACGIISLVAALGFSGMHLRVGHRFAASVEEMPAGAEIADPAE